MNNNSRILLAAVITAVVITLLFFIVPVTGTFVVSYIFGLIGVCGIALSLFVFGKGNNKAPQGFAYIHTASIYGLTCIIVSVILYIISVTTSLPIMIPVFVHVAVLAFFTIRILALSSGNEYITKLDEKAEEKHKEFEKKKETYWK